MEKCTHVKTTSENLIQKKNICMHPPVTLCLQCSFDSTKHMLDCYRGKNFMERFCKDIKEHATKIINYEEKRNDTTN